MTFVQIIEMTTTKVPEIEGLMNEWMAATAGRRSASRRTDLSRPQQRMNPQVNRGFMRYMDAARG